MGFGAGLVPIPSDPTRDFCFFCLRNVSYRNVFLKLSDVRTVYHCLRSLILRFKNRFFFFILMDREQELKGDTVLSFYALF